jgi:ribosome biogenesis GTPase
MTKHSKRKQQKPNDSPVGVRGLVIETSGGFCQVEIDNQIQSCQLRRTLPAKKIGFTNAVAVGDEVIVGDDGSDGLVVEAVLARRTILTRPDVGRTHLQQIIVANADQLLIVVSWHEPPIWPELIDRYLIAAERSELQPIICINKIDLAENEAYQPIVEIYHSLGYRVVLTSVVQGIGIEELRDLLQHQTTVLTGLSGVGKSSLLAAIQPDLQLRTGAISHATGEGRHTTTQATLFRLEFGGAVVDTPGIREFGLAGLERDELAGFFPEMAELIPDCRFRNCTHLNEPTCAIKMAVETGHISASRYHSYQLIYETL